jgi:hypothetical protein
MKKGIVAAFLILASCKSTESINRFARSAASGISELDQKSFSFGRFCQLYNAESLGSLTDTALYGRIKRPKPECGPEKNSDSLVGIINHTLKDYFSLLQAVSDKKLLSYNAGPLVAALQDIQPQLLPSLSFSDEKATALKGLLNTLLNEPLSYYRARKLKKLIRDNDSALSAVIRAYIFILDPALRGEMNQANENYRSFVYAPMFERSVTPVEKAMVNNQYREFLEKMEEERLKLQKSVRMLETVQKGHHLLAGEGEKESFAEIEPEIAGDILLINKLVSDIIRLTQ